MQRQITWRFDSKQSSAVSEEEESGWRVQVEGKVQLSLWNGTTWPLPFFISVTFQMFRPVGWQARGQQRWVKTRRAAKHTLRQHEGSQRVTGASFESVKMTQRSGVHQGNKENHAC